MAINLYVSDESGTTGGIQNISVWTDRRQLEERVEASILSSNNSERYLANVTANASFYIRSYSPPRASYQRTALDIGGERQATVGEITRLIRR
jgi:hypothetical protein